jgi:hypothetical protein
MNTEITWLPWKGFSFEGTIFDDLLFTCDMRDLLLDLTIPLPFQRANNHPIPDMMPTSNATKGIKSTHHNTRSIWPVRAVRNQGLTINCQSSGLLRHQDHPK